MSSFGNCREGRRARRHSHFLMEVIVKQESVEPTEQRLHLEIKEEVINDHNEEAPQQDTGLQRDFKYKIELGPEVLQPCDSVFVPPDSISNTDVELVIVKKEPLETIKDHLVEEHIKHDIEKNSTSTTGVELVIVKQEPLETIKDHLDVSRSEHINPKIGKNKNSGKIPHTHDDLGKGHSKKILLYKQKQASKKLYTCKICNKQCSRKYTLRKHLGSHTIYNCDFCNKQFGAKSRLDTHQRIHTGEKPYVCDICTRAFSQKCHLIGHILTIHKTCPTKSDKTYTCEHCGKDYWAKSSLRKHLKSHLKRKTVAEVVNVKQEPLEIVNSHTTDSDIRRIPHISVKIEECETSDEIPYAHEGFTKKFSKKIPLHKHEQAQSKKVYTCKICNKQCTKEYTLKRHLESHTIHTCNICYKQFATRTHLNRHERTHTGEKPYVCDICTRPFTQKGHLIGHIHTKHEYSVVKTDITYTCEKCGKQCWTKDSFAKHFKIHQKRNREKKRNICEICNKEFSSKHKVRQHQTVHTGEKPYLCEICNKSFTQRGHMNTHKRLKHSGVAQGSQFSCDICQEQFNDKRYLVRHIRIHMGKLYSCDKCTRDFATESSLATHYLIHTEDKLTKCTICEKRFLRKETLANHMRLHTGERPFSCSMCEKSFTTSSALGLHNNRNHSGGKSLSCNICEKNFAYKSALTIHMRIHTGEKPFHCIICEDNFISKHKLNVHMRKHTEDKSVSACGTEFSCGMCYKQFSTRQSMENHVVTVHVNSKP